MTYAEIEVGIQTNSYTFLTFRRKSILMTLPIATMINSTTAIEVGNLIATLYSDWNPLSWSLNVKKISSSLDIRYSLFTPVWYLLIPHKLGYSSLLVRSTPLGVGFLNKPLMQIRLLPSPSASGSSLYQDTAAHRHQIDAQGLRLRRRAVRGVYVSDIYG